MTNDGVVVDVSLEPFQFSHVIFFRYPLVWYICLKLQVFINAIVITPVAKFKKDQKPTMVEHGTARPFQYNGG